MAAEFTLGAGEERIEVRRLEFSTSAEKQKSAAELKSTISLKIGAFSGSLNAVFATQELVVLREQLVNSLASGAGKVSFRNRTGDLDVEIELNDQGGVIISGKVQPHRLHQATLNFRFETDKSSLANTAQELDDVLSSFTERT